MCGRRRWIWVDGGGGDWGSGRGDETLEELDLVEGSFGVSGSGFDDFESDVSVHFVVLCEPDGGEMAPAEFPDDGVSAIGKGVANVDGVVAALDIVFPVFLVLGHDRS